MNFKIETIPRFEKDVKKLKKKFPKIKNDLTELMNKLSLNPEIGINLGENIFKIRFQNSSIPIGKSGGFRIITYYKTDDILTEKLKKIVQEEIVSH